jgi:hypothetical protein
MLESAYGTLRTLASTIRNIMVRQKKYLCQLSECLPMYFSFGVSALH